MEIHQSWHTIRGILYLISSFRQYGEIGCYHLHLTRSTISYPNEVKWIAQVHITTMAQSQNWKLGLYLQSQTVCDTSNDGIPHGLLLLSPPLVCDLQHECLMKWQDSVEQRLSWLLWQTTTSITTVWRYRIVAQLLVETVVVAVLLASLPRKSNVAKSGAILVAIGKMATCFYIS